MITPQEIFDTVGRAILKQGTRSATPSGECMYRSNRDGVTYKCAVGHLISDEMYTPYMEGCSIDGVIERFPDLDWPPYLKPNLELLKDMQVAHDLCDNSVIRFDHKGSVVVEEPPPESESTLMANFVTSMLRVAKKHGLDGTRFQTATNRE